MSDIFHEVDEELQRDKLASLWSRYQAPLIVVAVLIVASTGAWSYYQQQRQRAAEAANVRYEAAEALSREGKSAEAQAAFEVMVKDSPRGYAALARIRAAQELAKTDKAKAITDLEAIAVDKSVDKLTQEVAQLRAAIFAMELDDREKAAGRLAPLMTDAGVFRYSAQEWTGLDALENGDYDEAERVFDLLASDGAAPQGMRQRAAAYRGLLHAARGPKKSETSNATVTPLIEPAK
jgi:hypothetical protein